MRSLAERRERREAAFFALGIGTEALGRDVLGTGNQPCAGDVSLVKEQTAPRTQVAYDVITGLAGLCFSSGKLRWPECGGVP